MLTLQFGQCGNQLGYEFYSLINQDLQSKCSILNDYTENSKSKWYEVSDKSEKQIAKAILIDTETKVINEIIKKNKNDSWFYRSKNIITNGDGGGSANNWAFGYLVKGPEFEELVLEAIRTELECADKLDGYLCLLGSAGGTGSGLGSYVMKSLRQEFPTKNIISILVFPFLFGEVATQNYNIILSLSEIFENTDLIVTFHNDQLKNELYSKLAGSSKISKINYPSDLNKIACQKLISVFQPATDDNAKANKVNYIISKLVPHPGYKLTSIESYAVNLNLTDSVVSTWQSQYRNLKKKLSVSYYESTKFVNRTSSKSLANILITRGLTENKTKNFFQTHTDNFENYLDLNKCDVYSQIKWMISEERFTHFHQDRKLFNYDKLATVITNNSCIHKTLDDIVRKAWTTYSYGAYLHQYKKFGLDNNDFLKAFAKVEANIASYKSLENV